MQITGQRMFNGVRFSIDASTWVGVTKAVALKKRDAWKKVGRKARVVKNEQGKYVVYWESK